MILYLFSLLIDSLLDWLIDWLIDSLLDWLIDWLIDSLLDWLINWLIDCLLDWFSSWLIESPFKLINHWLVYWLIDSQNNFLLINCRLIIDSHFSLINSIFHKLKYKIKLIFAAYVYCLYPSQNFCVVNLGVKNLYPSYTDGFI